MIRLRRMTKGDFSFAVSLTDKEDWGYVQEDFERLLSYEPEGCFVTEADKRPIGLVTTTSYGSLGWIGNVIVDEEFREGGVGKLLVQTSLDYLRSIGVKTVHLTSYLNTIKFYERLGFKPEFTISSLSVEAGNFRSQNCQVAGKSDVNRILEFDASYFGGDRSRIIRRMMRDFPKLLLVTDGDPFGYVAASCTEKSCEIGPLITELGSVRVAEELLKGILHSVPADRARIFVPHINERAMELATSLGFREDFKTVRMLYGEVNERERTEGIYAIGALEKG